MSTTDDADKSRPELENPDTKEQIEAAREQLREEKEEEKLPGQTASQEEITQSRETVAAGVDASHLPGTVTQEVDWRGVALEFEELGDTLDTIGEMESDPETSEGEMTAFARKKLAEKCTDPAATLGYWQQFDLQRSDDVDGILDLVQRLAGAGDAEAQAKQERAKTFRNE